MTAKKKNEAIPDLKELARASKKAVVEELARAKRERRRLVPSPQQRKDGVLADIHLERKGELLDLKFTANEAAYTAGCTGLARVLAGLVPMVGAAQTMLAKEAAAFAFPDNVPQPPPHLDAEFEGGELLQLLKENAELKRQLTMTVEQRCHEFHIQDCHDCPNEFCGDNTNPLLNQLKQFRKKADS